MYIQTVWILIFFALTSTYGFIGLIKMFWIFQIYNFGANGFGLLIFVQNIWTLCNWMARFIGTSCQASRKLVNKRVTRHLFEVSSISNFLILWVTVNEAQFLSRLFGTNILDRIEFIGKKFNLISFRQFSATQLNCSLQTQNLTCNLDFCSYCNIEIFSAYINCCLYWEEGGGGCHH